CLARTGGQMFAAAAFRSALPSASYSASVSRRSRLPSAGRTTPCTGLSERIRRLTAYVKIAPNSPTARLAAPLPPRTRASPRGLVLVLAAVFPSALSQQRPRHVLRRDGGHPDLSSTTKGRGATGARRDLFRCAEAPASRHQCRGHVGRVSGPARDRRVRLCPLNRGQTES